MQTAMHRPASNTVLRGNAFTGNRALLARAALPQQRRVAVRVEAYAKEWPNAEFIKEVKANFPEQGIANVEEARVLFSELGYVYLDVRPQLEYEEAGRVRGSVNIPVQFSKRVYNKEENRKIVVKEANPDFLKMVRNRYPDKKTKILVGCSDGKSYSIEALETLEEDGYVNLAGLKGGFYAWFKVFDNKLARRFKAIKETKVEDVVDAKSNGKTTATSRGRATSRSR